MIRTGINWVYQSKDEKIAFWLIEEYKILYSLLVAITNYHLRRKKYPLRKCREFISRVWVLSLHPVIGLKEKIKEKEERKKNLEKLFEESRDQFFEIGRILKRKGILDIGKKVKFTKEKAEGDVFGFA